MRRCITRDPLQRPQLAEISAAAAEVLASEGEEGGEGPLEGGSGSEGVSEGVNAAIAAGDIAAGRSSGRSAAGVAQLSGQKDAQEQVDAGSNHVDGASKVGERPQSGYVKALARAKSFWLK
jgi:hypothetical protein